MKKRRNDAESVLGVDCFSKRTFEQKLTVNKYRLHIFYYGSDSYNKELGSIDS